MKKIILIGPGSTSCRHMLADLENYKAEDFEYIAEPIRIKNRFIRYCFHMYFRINSKIRLPFPEIWSKWYTLPEMVENRDDIYYVILANGDFNYYSSRWLNKQKKKKNLHYIVFLIDPLSGLLSNYMTSELFSTEYEWLYTFDYEDAKKINAIHIMNLYSAKRISGENKVMQNTGVYFAGTNKKNRVDIVHQIYKRLVTDSVECKFRITKVPTSMQTQKKIIYNDTLSYDEVLKELQEYSCILEILQSGQVGVTLRYYEAIVYNKKLLTNNPLVKKLPFYNPEYMQVFSSVEDIDTEWIKKNVAVDYGYHDEFSPIKFIEDVRRRIHNENS